EEGDLDLAWEEEILQAGEAAALVLLHVVLGQVAHEVAGDAHVEEELTGTAPLVEREWLAGLDEVERGGLATRRALLRHHLQRGGGRGSGRRRGGRRRGGRGGRRRLAAAL